MQQALLESAPAVSAWHVLAAEIDSQGRTKIIPVDFAALAASGRAVIPVFRIEGTALPSTAAESIVTTLRRWPDTQKIETIEIDHDSAVRRLSDYARFLEKLRAAIGPQRRLSMTLLPDWLDSPDMPLLLNGVDEGVLQLHGLPRVGSQIFEPARARQWFQRMAQFGKPFRIALPNYGSRLTLDEAGRIVGVESEVPAALAQDETRELFVAPSAMAAFLQRLEKTAPSNLLGVVWFRLPVAGDARIWSRSTWHAVMRGEKTSVQLRAEWHPSDTGNRGQGGRERGDISGEIVLRNVGEHDAELPAQIFIDRSCRSEMRVPYLLETEAAGSALLRSRKGLLRAGAEVRLGWLRCSVGNTPVSVHVVD